MGVSPDELKSAHALMTHETKRRRAIAQSVVLRLAAKTDLKASMLTGSVAQGTADVHSDIDLLNYYESAPALTTFDAVLRALGAVRTGHLPESHDEGFALSYQVEGIEVQTGAQLIGGLEKRLKRIADGDVDWITAKVAMGLQEALPLKGEALIRDWQAQTGYPDSLRRREVEANLGWFPVWTLDAHLAARDAELFRRQMLLEGAFRVIAVLSALNRLYFTTFQFKRIHTHADRMKLKPNHLADRLDQVANEAPSVAADVLRALVEETKEIVRGEMPAIDVDVAWKVDLGAG
jgi:predicted nucleotidyltransferase